VLKAFSLFAFAAITYAGPLTVGPINVNGSGEIDHSGGDTFITESFSGSNGTDSVSVSFSGELLVWVGTAEIDGIEACDQVGFGLCLAGASFNRSLDDPGSVVIVHTSDNTPIATAIINGAMTDVKFSSNGSCGPAPFNYCETYTISPIPEPSTAWPIVAGLAALAAVRVRREKPA
jgi:hypothetical protein